MASKSLILHFYELDNNDNIPIRMNAYYNMSLLELSKKFHKPVKFYNKFKQEIPSAFKLRGNLELYISPICSN